MVSLVRLVGWETGELAVVVVWCGVAVGLGGRGQVRCVGWEMGDGIGNAGLKSVVACLGSACCEWVEGGIDKQTEMHRTRRKLVDPSPSLSSLSSAVLKTNYAIV